MISAIIRVYSSLHPYIESACFVIYKNVTDKLLQRCSTIMNFKSNLTGARYPPPKMVYGGRPQNYRMYDAKQNVAKIETETTQTPIPFGPKDPNRMLGVSPSDIDKYSRVVFPVCFVCFNLTYWIIYMHISAKKLP